MTTKAEIAWAAGLFEGEGSICTSPTKRSATRRIVLSSTDKDVLERFGAVVEAGKLYGPHKQRGKGYKPIYTWSISDYKEVQRIAEAFLPWLGKRRTEAVEQFMEELPDGPRPAQPKEQSQMFNRCPPFQKHRFSYREEKLDKCLRCGEPNPY